jgi:hypothetical protein
MTTMGERKVTEKQQPLPPKIERRLADLVQLEEFDQGDVRHCRCSYWGARDAWHQILIDCYAVALARQQHQPDQQPARTTGRPK